MAPTKRNAMGRTLMALMLSGVMVSACAADGEETCLAALDGGHCTGLHNDGGDRHDAAPSPTQLISLEISPADPVLVAADGMHPTQTFTVTGHQRDGRTRPVTNVRYSLDVDTIGTLSSATATFTSAGVGGFGHVRADMIDGTGLSATTSLTVNARHEVRGPGVTDTDIARFMGATVAADAATTSPVVNYPLDRAVMPRNVHPPRVMWTARHADAAATDLYHVRLARPHAVLEGYFANTPDLHNAWSLADDFATLAASDIGEPITLTVTSLSASGVRVSTPVTFRTIDGVVAGSVYYWSPPQGRLFRIDVDTAARVDFLPRPPGGTCIACHAVSRDGRHLAGIIYHGSSEPGRLAGYDLTADLTVDSPPTTFQTSAGLWAASFSPDANRVASIHYDGSSPLTIIDSASGSPLAAMSANASGGDPEWSPDGASIAYTDSSNVMTVGIDSANTFGAPAMVHAGASAGGVDWHPTWTPDSQWLVFQSGDQVFTRGAAALFMTPHSGGPAVRLDNLNGGATATDNFRPVFSPFNSGGYFWVLFTSTRAYGNAEAGVAAGTKQIWVAAIRNRPDGTTDPSEVAYYLDGQEAVTNLSPYWAPPPCRDNGSSCASGSQCCSGECDPDSSGAPTCRPPTTTCRMRGTSCGGSADCCPGLVCTDAHICDLPLPG